MGIEVIRELIDSLKSLDINELLNEILRDVSVQRFILDLNREDQLFDRGIDAKGTRLSSIGGKYSPVTLRLSKTRKKSLSDINLKDTGDFYASFKIKLNPKSFDIDADTIKESTDLMDRWGKDILGLTEDSLEKLREKVLPLLLNKIRERLAIL